MTHNIEILATVLFALAILHTFCTAQFGRIASRFPEGSLGENLFHLLGEVEVVFGLWAGVLLAGIAVTHGEKQMLSYLHECDFTEAAFVFVIMAIAATKPVLTFANAVIGAAARLLPLPGGTSFYFTALVLGPLLGSFITEPAAMTVTALVLKERVFDRGGNPKFLYLSLGVLFVNVSIGGVLTPYAAPPVLMVAAKWNWDFAFMFSHFGWKSVASVLLNAGLATAYGWKTLSAAPRGTKNKSPVPLGMSLLHVVLLGGVVHFAHYPLAFLAVFLMFLGVMSVTREYQDELRLRESLLVGFFLAGLVVLGGLQGWWLKDFLERLGTLELYVGAAALTAITDNAALTFLGSQVPTLTEEMKSALVSGAVVGGGLTVIANAPNPAGYSILRSSFGKDGISPLGLFLGALIPTLVALILFWFLPSAA